MRSKQKEPGEQDGRQCQRFVKLWADSFLFSVSITHTGCLGLVFARIRRTRGRSALCATKPVTLRANAPINQVLRLLLRLLLLRLHLQQAPMRAPLPLQSIRLLPAHGSTNWRLTLSTLRVLSLILRPRHSDQGLLRQILRLYHPNLPPRNRSIQL